MIQLPKLEAKGFKYSLSVFKSTGEKTAEAVELHNTLLPGWDEVRYFNGFGFGLSKRETLPDANVAETINPATDSGELLSDNQFVASKEDLPDGSVLVKCVFTGRTTVGSLEGRYHSVFAADRGRYSGNSQKIVSRTMIRNKFGELTPLVISRDEYIEFSATFLVKVLPFNSNLIYRVKNKDESIVSEHRATAATKRTLILRNFYSIPCGGFTTSVSGFKLLFKAEGSSSITENNVYTDRHPIKQIQYKSFNIHEMNGEIHGFKYYIECHGVTLSYEIHLDKPIVKTNDFMLDIYPKGNIRVTR